MKGYILYFASRHASHLGCMMTLMAGFVFLSANAWAAEICEVEITSCPEDFAGDTIMVTNDVVALSAEVYACEPADIKEGYDTTVIDSGCTPSIMFLIDNSGSMTGVRTQNEGRDRWGSRYSVVGALLDTIYKVYPDAEVGMAVFRDYLYFNPNNNSHPFSQLFVSMPQTYDDNPNQGYLPFLKLNQVYSQNKTGLQIIKDILAVDTLQGESEQYVDLTYDPGYPTQGYTNINMGFLAVQEAFKTAVNPRQCQYVIFFSDGEANDGDNEFNADRDQRWFTGGQNVPTTFTIYFTGGSLGETAHPDLFTMTDNIAANGYSTKNPVSYLWAIQTNHDTLLALLTEHVLGILFNTQLSVFTGDPLSMVINNRTAQSETDTSFIFSQRFALEADVTKFNMTIQYLFTNQNTGEKRDSTLTFDFYIKRQAGAALSQGVVKNCWTQPTLDLLYNNVSLLGSTVNETMNNLTVKLDPNGETMSSANVSVLSSLETEGLTMTQSGEVWLKDFQRIYTTTPVIDDKKLQHLISGDSIIVVWRNPNLPLDTVRIAVPFKVTRSLEMSAGYYFDRNADGYIDSIYVDMGVDSISAADLEELKKLVTLPSSRSFSNVRYVTAPGGFAILVDESKSNAPNTAVGSGDVLKISGGILPQGGIVSQTQVTIQDRMAPVIVNATLEIGETAGNDKLVIEFSEVITQVTSTEPFYFKVGATQYHVSVQEISPSEGVKYTFRVVNMTGADKQNAGDSVWINPSGYVFDLKGNKQENPANRRVALSVKVPPFELVPFTANNPYRADKGVSPQQAAQINWSINYVVQQYNEARARGEPVTLPDESGPIIIVKPEGPAAQRVDTLYGTVSIYDVVKNVIIENHPMVFDPDTKQLVYMWDSRNRNDKLVATGSYVAMMKLTSRDGSVDQVKTVRIGVKR